MATLAMRTLQFGLDVMRRFLPGHALYLAQPRHTGDNAAMIAFAAHVNPSGTTTGDGLKLSIEPSLELV